MGWVAASGWGGMVRAALDETMSLVLPVDCAGCGTPGWDLCPTCDRALAPAPRRREVGGLEVWSGLDFDGVAARAMRALKAEGRTGLARHLAPTLLAAVACHRRPGAVLVPVPTSPAAMRRRGYRVTELLARRAGLDIRPLLRSTRRVADQRTLGVLGRAHNTAGSLRSRGAEGLRVIVVDDVMTTGATLREARRALVEAGADVVGGAVALGVARRGRGIDAHGSPT